MAAMDHRLRLRVSRSFLCGICAVWRRTAKRCGASRTFRAGVRPPVGRSSKFRSRGCGARIASLPDLGWRAPGPVAMDRIFRTEKCAWQESNLLPFGPEPNALSGELQARERFSLDCGVRGSIFIPVPGRRPRSRVPKHRATGANSDTQPIAPHRCRRRSAAVERRHQRPQPVCGHRSARHLHQQSASVLARVGEPPHRRVAVAANDGCHELRDRTLHIRRLRMHR